jgi:hypothetical protein
MRAMGKDQDDGGSWIDEEIESSGFGDARHGDRLRKLMSCLDSATGQPLPLACEDWANTKAAYRFLSNDAVTEEQILAGHFQATARRAASCDGTLLVLQDTTEFVYQRSAPDSIGYTNHVNSGRDKEGRWRQHKLCGVLMHASLTPGEIDVIDRIAMRAGRPPGTAQTLSAYLVEIARLGGYLARRRDPPPGNMIMWRGWSRLMDIQLGATLANQPLVGN